MAEYPRRSSAMPRSIYPRLFRENNFFFLNTLNGFPYILKKPIKLLVSGMHSMQVFRIY